MRYARRRDGNHLEIVHALESIGVGVYDAGSAGGGLTDLVTFYRGKVDLIEIKDGKKPPSQRKLTPAQIKLHAMAQHHGVSIPVIESVDQALAYFQAIPSA